MNQARNPNLSVKIYIVLPCRMLEVGTNLSALGDAIDETQEDSSSSLNFFFVWIVITWFIMCTVILTISWGSTSICNT